MASETYHASISMLLKTAGVCQDKPCALALHVSVKVVFPAQAVFLKTQVVTMHTLVQELVQMTGTVLAALLASVEVVPRQALNSLILLPQSSEMLQK